MCILAGAVDWLDQMLQGSPGETRVPEGQPTTLTRKTLAGHVLASAGLALSGTLVSVKPIAYSFISSRAARSRSITCWGALSRQSRHISSTNSF